MNIKEFIANKKAEINKEWGCNQKDEWNNGYYNALSDIEKALSQHDVIKNEVAVCDCHKSKLVQMCSLPDCHGGIPT